MNWHVQINMELDVNYLISIAERAGQAIMDVYHGDTASWDVDHKSDDSPLTRADKEANKIICDALMDWTPHIPIISEENSVAPFVVRQVRISHLPHSP
jgi:3'(2'), 5'-bisphosphate nucleotidase